MKKAAIALFEDFFSRMGEEERRRYPVRKILSVLS